MLHCCKSFVLCLALFSLLLQAGCASQEPEQDPLAPGTETFTYPATYRQIVKNEASVQLNAEFPLILGIYVSTQLPEKTLYKDKLSYHGQFVVQYEDIVVTDRGDRRKVVLYDLFDYYFTHSGLVLEDARNDALELGRSLLALGTLGLSRMLGNAVSDEAPICKKIVREAKSADRYNAEVDLSSALYVTDYTGIHGIDPHIEVLCLISGITVYEIVLNGTSVNNNAAAFPFTLAYGQSAIVSVTGTEQLRQATFRTDQGTGSFYWN